MYNKLPTEKQAEAHTGTVSPASSSRNLCADHHPSRIRLYPDYSIPQLAANLFILAGVKVRHGAVASRMLKGGRA